MPITPPKLELAHEGPRRCRSSQDTSKESQSVSNFERHNLTVAFAPRDVGDLFHSQSAARPTYPGRIRRRNQRGSEPAVVTPEPVASHGFGAQQGDSETFYVEPNSALRFFLGDLPQASREIISASQLVQSSGLSSVFFGFFGSAELFIGKSAIAVCFGEIWLDDSGFSEVVDGFLVVLWTTVT